MKALMTVVLGLLLLAAPAFAAEARVSQESLAKLGLGGMQAISDVEATAIRGTPFYFWPPEQMTYVIPAFQFRLVIQWLPTGRRVGGNTQGGTGFRPAQNPRHFRAEGSCAPSHAAAAWEPD